MYKIVTASDKTMLTLASGVYMIIRASNRPDLYKVELPQQEGIFQVACSSKHFMVTGPVICWEVEGIVL